MSGGKQKAADELVGPSAKSPKLGPIMAHLPSGLLYARVVDECNVVAELDLIANLISKRAHLHSRLCPESQAEVRPLLVR